MKVCFFGIYNPRYGRNYVLKAGFLKHGYSVIECHVDPQQYPGLRKYWQLYQAFREMETHAFDYVIVCFPGHITVFIARILFGRKIILDLFVSLYDANVYDRKTYGPHTLWGLRDWLLDWSSCHMAHTLLLDTQAHIDFFVRTFGISQRKFIRVFVGADEHIFYPRERDEDTEIFVVHFHGSFIPLHGLPYIIEAIHLLRDEPILFRIIGEGQHSQHIRKYIRDLDLEGRIQQVGRVSLEKIAFYISQCDIALGIFGISPKTARVIPNKVYEALATGKALITADTPAARELLVDKETALLVPQGNASAIAQAIRTLRHDIVLREEMGERARTLFLSSLLPEKIVGDLLDSLHKNQLPASSGAVV